MLPVEIAQPWQQPAHRQGDMEADAERAVAGRQALFQGAQLRQGGLGELQHLLALGGEPDIAAVALQ
ncbi:hypothetical protein D9M69_577550 [compost metagenome]